MQRLEPFGVGNPQPVFAARAVRLMAPPRNIKDKHVKLKLASAIKNLSSVAREDGQGKWRDAITFNALGWHMAERCQQAGLLPGDEFEIAFSIDNNDHPECGGLELLLRDFVRPGKAESSKKDDAQIQCESTKKSAAASP